MPTKTPDNKRAGGQGQHQSFVPPKTLAEFGEKVRVKSSLRKGKLVRGYVRDKGGNENRKRGVAMITRGALLSAAGIAGIYLSTKKFRGLKPKVTSLATPLRGIDTRLGATLRNLRRRRQSSGDAIKEVERMFLRLAPHKQVKVKSELMDFDALASRYRMRGSVMPDDVTYKNWKALSPETKAIGLESMRVSLPPSDFKRFKNALLQEHRRQSSTFKKREQVLSRAGAYVKQHRKGDASGRSFDSQKFRSFRNKLRQDAPRSASDIRNEIRRDLGFSRNHNTSIVFMSDL